MSDRFATLQKKVLSGWAKFVLRRAIWVVVSVVTVTMFLFHYARENLGFNTDLDEMISPELPFRKVYAEYREAFPQYMGVLMVFVEADTTEFAKEASRILTKQINGDREYFIEAYIPEGGEFIEKNGLMFLSLDELEDLTNDLARAQPALSILYRDQSLRGLFDMLEVALGLLDEDPEIDLNLILKNLNQALKANLEGRKFRLSWQEMMSNKESKIGDLRKIILVRPHFDYSRLLPAKDALARIRRFSRELEEEKRWGIRVRITGGPALGHDEMESLASGSTEAGVLSLFLVCIALLVGLRSFPMVCATLLSLIIGIIWTAGFAALVIGHLNLISIAFAVLYIGLGVDYAIHLCLCYREKLLEGKDKEEALKGAIVDIGPSLNMCTISTAIGFYSFIPTAYAGVSELGLISGTGMFISLIISLSVLPAILSILPSYDRKSYRPSLPREQRGPSIISRYSPSIRWVSLGFLIVSASLIFHARFEFDPIRLRDPSTESASSLLEYIETSDRHPSSIIILGSDEEETRRISKAVKKLETVGKVISIDDLVPGDQEEKLLLTEDLELIIGASFFDTEPELPPSLSEQIEQMESFLNELGEYPEVARMDQLVRMESLLNQLLRLIEKEDEKSTGVRIADLEKGMLETLPLALDALNTSLNSEPFDRKELPEEIRDRWISENERFRIQVFSNLNISENEALIRFVNEVRTVASNATSGPIFTYEAGRTIVYSFKQAFLSALLLITVLLIAIFRNWAEPLLVLIPLLVAGLFTGAATVLMGASFNFANIIALPLLLGLGVDNGIHMVHRMRSISGTNTDFLHTSTARGVLFSGLTTMFSFGTLMFLSHRGTASLGQLLCLGVFLTMTTTLIILPSYYLLRSRRSN
ncbi:MAG: Sulfolipid-1 exporter MmpL8 [Candidatus Moanabacter tarae]|uniref:Sulfolipid-1 exporter MmpL8 n=1 Tax=Candidatus Moanibacter tarae TaxID=2200854 RepID=A0A2Z4ADM3_9BACT|nr:MAG: Sulfolipid-1 exporter MmpL8 [Candidatus Moanabacter tarae]